MKKRGFTIRVGPLAMSLAAAALTAIAFAAISLADNGSGGDNGGNGGKDTQTFVAPAPPGAGAGVRFFANPDLSDADKQKLEDFRNCMEQNGAPAPPDPSDFKPGEAPPKPPSAEDQDKIQKAWEACKDKLPEAMQKAGPPQLRVAPCAPPGAPGAEQGQKQNQDQSDDSGSGSSSSSS